MWDLISQVAIVILGTSSIILLAKKNKWGFVLGLAAQPFWYITAFVNQQWGVFLVSFVYTLPVGYSEYTSGFLKKRKAQKKTNHFF